MMLTICKTAALGIEAAKKRTWGEGMAYITQNARPDERNTVVRCAILARDMMLQGARPVAVYEVGDHAKNY